MRAPPAPKGRPRTARRSRCSSCKRPLPRIREQGTDYRRKSALPSIMSLQCIDTSSCRCVERRLQPCASGRVRVSGRLGWPRIVVARSGARKERLELLAHQLVQNARLGITPLALKGLALELGYRVWGHARRARLRSCQPPLGPILDVSGHRRVALATLPPVSPSHQLARARPHLRLRIALGRSFEHRARIGG
jgi:hypothetical protein